MISINTRRLPYRLYATARWRTLMYCAFVSMLYGFCTSCTSEQSTPLTLEFRLVPDLHQLAPLNIDELKFFVSDVHLLDSAGKPHAAQLQVLAPWQAREGGLIKLDALGERINYRLTVDAPIAKHEIAGLRFNLGLAPEVNHQNPLTATSPFNISSMFWSWQLGYKFFRLDFREAGGQMNMHLGSTGCQSASPIRPPSKPCHAPNIAQITLPDFRAEQHIIGVDVSGFRELIREKRLAQPHSPAHLACTGNYQQNILCQKSLALFGLASTTGQCQDECAAQRVFHAVARQKGNSATLNLPSNKQ